MRDPMESMGPIQMTSLAFPGNRFKGEILPELEKLEDLVLLGEAPDALLREDELAVCDHVVLALRALDGARFDPVLVQDGRETRGPAVVAASDGAVVDLDGHAPPYPMRAGRCRSTIAASSSPGGSVP